MAGSWFFSALSFLSFAASAFSILQNSPKSLELLPRKASDICEANSKCKPFRIKLTWEDVNPTNGIARKAIMVNGSFPGPPLSLKVGECVDFVVVNNLPDVTGVHFHGITQEDTPWADGVPGLTQYPIKVGESYMYRWTAHESGMYFYHAHYKGQMMDGLYGAIIIAPADDAEKPFSMIDGASVDALSKAEDNVEPIFVSDWTQYTFNEFYQIQQKANIDNACTDSIILNGLGSVYCLNADQIKANSSPALPRILGNQTLTAKGCVPANNALTQGNYTRNLNALPENAYNKCNAAANKNYTVVVDPADGWAAITLINPGGFSLLKATIDNHKLYVYELNGHYIVPQTVDQITVGNGDRISFFVKLDQEAADYTIRIANNGVNQVISGYGTLSYKGSSGSATSATALMNYGGQNTTAIVAFSEIRAAPYPAVQVSTSADASHKLDIMKTPNQPNAYTWTLSGISSYDQSRDDQTPLLYQKPDSIPESDLIIKTQKDSWVDLIVVVSGPLAQPHPLHKHANKFFVIGSGTGNFTWDSVADAQAAGISFNLDNPPFVDGYTTLPSPNGASWAVFRYKAEIPGAWFMHCHIQTHFSGGMAIAILDAVDDFPQVPSDVGKVCSSNGSGNDDNDGNDESDHDSSHGEDDSHGDSHYGSPGSDSYEDGNDDNTKHDDADHNGTDDDSKDNDSKGSNDGSSDDSHSSPSDSENGGNSDDSHEDSNEYLSQKPSSSGYGSLQPSSSDANNAVSTSGLASPSGSVPYSQSWNSTNPYGTGNNNVAVYTGSAAPVFIPFSSQRFVTSISAAATLAFLLNAVH